MISETRIDVSSAASHFATPFKFRQSNYWRSRTVYFPNIIPAKLLNLSNVFSDTRCLEIEISLPQIKQFFISSYHPRRNSISNCLTILSQLLKKLLLLWKISLHKRFLFRNIWDCIKLFCDVYYLKSAAKELFWKSRQLFM